MSSEIDLTDLLQTLTRLTNGRILPFAETTKVSDVTEARIPVASQDEADLKEVRLSRFIRDWLHRKKEEIGTDCRLEVFKKPMTYTDPAGVQHPVTASLLLTWWPKPKPTQYEELIELQRKKKQAPE